MTREDVLSIFSEATPEQITAVLNRYQKDVAAEKATAKSNRERAEKADDLQQEIENLKQQLENKGDDSEVIEGLRQQIADLKRTNVTSEVKAIMMQAGLTEEQITPMLSGFVTEDLEASKTLATAFVDNINQVRTDTANKTKEDFLKNTQGLGGGETKKQEKSADILNAEGITFGSLSENAQSDQDFYK